MQCLPFFVLLLDPANTGGLARRCCTSILSLQKFKKLMNMFKFKEHFAEYGVDLLNNFLLTTFQIPFDKNAYNLSLGIAL